MRTRYGLMSFLGMLTLAAWPCRGETPGPRGPVIGPQWKSVEESVDLPTGLKAHVTYHFNRNALSAACLTDDGLLAVADSGNLLRFDLKELRLLQEVRPAAAITHLTTAKGVGVLAACADGRVLRIDPKTLKLTEFAKLRATPLWITGFHDAARQERDAIAVLVSPRGELDLHWFGHGKARSETHKMPGLPFHRGGVFAYFLDGKSRLWLGRDGGEWGGGCYSLDLNGGAAGKVEDLNENVYGFVEMPDGQVWAYGGTMHLGFSSGSINRVDRGKSEELFSVASFGRDRTAKPDATPKRPRYPITHIIADPKGDGLLVLAFSDLFQVDAKLTSWRYLGSIQLHYRWGRPDAMGSYPALKTVLTVGNKSGDLICTTALDGIVRIREGKVTQYLVPGQIGDDWIERILPASGTSMLRGEDLWRYTRGSWRAVSMFPPAQPDPGEDWYEYSLMLDPDRRPMSFCRSNFSPGAAALTRLKDGKLEVLASEKGQHVTFSARGGFATPDGSYWCADREKLLRLEEGKWQQAGKAPEKSLWGLRVVGQGKPPWILHCKDSLYRLTPGKGAQDAALVPVPLLADLGKIHDALAIEAGQILLACTAGLRSFDEKSGKVSECPFPLPKGEVRALCRDGRGRTWLAGSGLWMVDGKGTVHDFAKLNQYGAVAHAIGADSTDPTCVIVALGRRGVLFVRAEAQVR